MRTVGESGGGVNDRVNEVKVLQSDQHSTVTEMRNYHLNPFSLFFFPLFIHQMQILCLFPRRFVPLIAVLAVKTDQWVSPSPSVDVSPYCAADLGPHVIIQTH